MSIIELGALGEFVGSIAVVITLIYLAVQIRANTRTTKANASFQATHSWAEVTQSLSELPSDQLDSLLRALSADTKGSDMTSEEYDRVRLMFRNFFQRLEGQYYLYKYGLLEPGVWEARSAIGRGMVQANPMLREWWAGDTNPLNYSQEFVDAVNQSDSIDATRLFARPAD
jgi:hypothetical protein